MGFACQNNRMRIDAIVPAHNESATIGSVVDALLGSGVLARVQVVDDGSSDDTALIAAQHGARVVRLARNLGKGGAMRVGWLQSRADAILFCDADLIGLTGQHIRSIVDPIVQGRADMAVGLRDYPGWNELQAGLPPITGERVVRSEFLRLIPDRFWDGFKIEAAMNAVVENHGGRIERVLFDGIKMRPKWDKIGLRRGLESATRMMVEVLAAMRDARSL